MSKAPPKKGDAVDLLDADHIAVKKLFDQFNKLAEADGPAEQRKELADRICMELTVHTQLEEELFYPPVREATGKDDIMDEADVEHDSAKDLIAQISAMGADESHFNAKVKVLGEMIDHHVTEEREKMFPEARKSDLDLVAMVEPMQARKEEIQRELEGAAA
jgi:hemerythrin superfamily protein